MHEAILNDADTHTLINTWAWVNHAWQTCVFDIIQAEESISISLNSPTTAERLECLLCHVKEHLTKLEVSGGSSVKFEPPLAHLTQLQELSLTDLVLTMDDKQQMSSHMSCWAELMSS